MTTVKCGLVATFAFVCWVGVAGIFVIRDAPVVVLEPPQVTGGDFFPGGWVNIEMRIERKEQCRSVRATRTFVDAQGIRHSLAPQIEWDDEQIGAREVTMRAPIPKAAAAGQGRFTVQMAFRCWPGQALFPVVVRLVDVAVTVE